MQELTAFLVLRSKLAVIHAAAKSANAESVASARSQIARALVTRFEGFVLRDWSKPNISDRCQSLFTKLVDDAKPFGIQDVSKDVQPVLLKAVQDAIST
jgi:hypothetical protein